MNPFLSNSVGGGSVVRQCPHCGCMDSPVWRNVRYRLYTSYCRIDELSAWEPELAKLIADRISQGNFADFTVGKYIYHIVKGNLVIQRIHVSDSRDGKSIREPEQEKHFKFVPMGQTRLVLPSKVEGSA